MFKKKEKQLVGKKTIAEIKAWLETHGIERSTAAHIHGFMKAYGIDLGAIQLCSYGLTYSFDEFLEWWNTDSSLEPKINKPAIFWAYDHSMAQVSILKDIDGEQPDQDGMEEAVWYESSMGMSYPNCCLFVSMAQYRMILNVPNDMDIPLPLGHLKSRKDKVTDKNVS